MNGVPSSYVYNSTNNSELTAVLGGCLYSYDGNGNLKAKTLCTPSWTYTWDSANRLVKVNSNNLLQGAYAYDGLSRRVESVESSTTFYAYYGTETLSELVSGGATTDYVYAGGLRIGRVSGTTVNYFHTDSLGNTRLVTDSSKAVKFSDNYQAYGSDNSASGSETYKFTGKPYSIATGLYYYFERWYDPTVGRFVNQDPLPGYAPDPQSLNPYVYVENTPTSLVDPTGAFDEFSNRDSMGMVSFPDEPFIPTADFFKNIETEYLVESENPALARIAPTTGAQTTLDQFTTEPNTVSSTRGGVRSVQIGNARQAQVVFDDYVNKGVNPNTIEVEKSAASEVTGRTVKFDIVAENTATEVKAGYVSGTDAKLQIRNQFEISREYGLQYRYVVYGRISAPVKNLLDFFNIPYEER